MTFFKAEFVVAIILTSAIVGVPPRAAGRELGALDVKLSPDETKACDDVWLELRPPRFFYGR